LQLLQLPVKASIALPQSGQNFGVFLIDSIFSLSHTGHNPTEESSGVPHLPKKFPLSPSFLYISFILTQQTNKIKNYLSYSTLKHPIYKLIKISAQI